MGQLRAASSGGSARSGRPTSAFRPHADAHSLRIGIVVNGRIVEERLLPPGGKVTIGTDADCTVVLPRGPRRFCVLDARPGACQLHFAGGMRGKMSRGAGLMTLESMRADGRARRGRGGRFTVDLDDSDRGKLKLGDTTILFQFVRTPPMPARRRKTRFAAWRWDQVDWIFLAVILLSALAHVAGVLWVESQPPPKTEAIQRIQSIFVEMMLDAEKAEKPTPEPTVTDADLDGPDSDTETPAPEPEGDAVADAAPEPESAPAPESAAERQERLEARANDTGVLALIPTAGDSTRGGRVRDLLADGTVSGEVKDAVVASSQGMARDDGEYGLRGGSSDDGVAGAGDFEGAGGGPGGDVQKDSVKVTPKTRTDPDWTPPPLTGEYDVRAQMRRYLGRIQACYERVIKDEPGLGGKMMVSWTIDSDGSVDFVSIGKDSTDSGDLRECVDRTMGRLKFTPPPDGSTIEVEDYPLLFLTQ